MDRILPSYKMQLVKKVIAAIAYNYPGKDAKYYLENWQEDCDDFRRVNFGIVYSDRNNEYVDLDETLNRIDGDIIVKMAIDLGIETPDFIPSIPIFRNEIKSDYQFAARTFEKAFKDAESDPDTACGLAVAALESIIKEIMSDSRIAVRCRDKNDIVKLTEDILKAFNLLPSCNMVNELKALGSGIITCSKALGDIRGDKSLLHGKKSGDVVVDDPICTYFVINCVCSIGFFLLNVYKSKFPPETQPYTGLCEDGSLPF